MVVAPQSTATLSTLARNSASERLASMALNSTSAPLWVLARSRASVTLARVSASTSTGVFLIWYFMCTGLVLMNVWMRGFSAALTAAQAASMSLSMARARPAMRGPLTSEAIGKPASMMSTRSLASWRAISSFSALFKVAPGACSPSRSVVSKILMYLLLLTSHPHLPRHASSSHGAADPDVIQEMAVPAAGVYASPRGGMRRHLRPARP